MKKSIFIAILMFASLNIIGQEVKWHSFEEAIEKNKSNPKKILIDVYTDWCGWCDKMKEETFNHPDIAEYINKHFYAVRFDAESSEEITFRGETFKKEGNKKRSPHQLAVALLQGKMSYPSVAYLNEDNQLITAVPGFYGAKDMEVLLKYFVEEAYKKEKFNDFQDNYEHTLITE
ncbi:MAG: thioredoxin family protein [Bacteroidota bacterium]